MDDNRSPEPEKQTSVITILLVSMFCGPLAMLMAWNAGYFHRNGKLDPMNLGFALVGLAIVLYIVVAIVLTAFQSPSPVLRPGP